MRCSTGARNCERQDEDNNLCASVHCCREQVVVLEIPSWVLPSDIVLSDKTEDEVDGHAGVDADAKVAEVPADQCGVEVVQTLSSAVSYDEAVIQDNGPTNLGNAL